MESHQHLKTHLHSTGILQVTLNRPDKLNALNARVLNELEQVFRQAKNENRVKGLLITGEGKAFCAGADIPALAELGADPGLDFAQNGQAVFDLLENLGKPSIAAINGYAFGGGLELAMAATLRTAVPEAQMGQPEVKLGVIPGYGGTIRLARLVGKGRALEACLTGRFLKSDEALSWGLINAQFSADTLLTDSLKMIHTITEQAPIAVKHILTSIHSGYDLPRAEALQTEATHFALCCATKDKQEGVSAFLEKRSPQFCGE